MNKFRAAVEMFGVAIFGRWLLPDGQFLAIGDGHDHRIVGQFCELTWLEFVRDGACSIHYDPKARYLWIRTAGLLTPQRAAFSRLFESGFLKVEELYIHEYEGLRQQECFHVYDYLAKLYLTDTVAYRIEASVEDQP